MIGNRHEVKPNSPASTRYIGRRLLPIRMTTVHVHVAFERPPDEEVFPERVHGEREATALPLLLNQQGMFSLAGKVEGDLQCAMEGSHLLRLNGTALHRDTLDLILSRFFEIPKEAANGNVRLRVCRHDSGPDVEVQPCSSHKGGPLPCWTPFLLLNESYRSRLPFKDELHDGYIEPAPELAAHFLHDAHHAEAKSSVQVDTGGITRLDP